MTIRLYLDEDTMSSSLVMALRSRGVDVATALENGMIEKPDREHLEWASSQGRVLYSFNVGDFSRLHTEFLSQGHPHAGLVLAKQQRYSVGEQMRRILRLIAARPAEEMCNLVEFLSAL